MLTAEKNSARCADLDGGLAQRAEREASLSDGAFFSEGNSNRAPSRDSRSRRTARSFRQSRARAREGAGAALRRAAEALFLPNLGPEIIYKKRRHVAVPEQQPAEVPE